MDVLGGAESAGVYEMEQETFVLVKKCNSKTNSPSGGVKKGPGMFSPTRSPIVTAYRTQITTSFITM